MSASSGRDAALGVLAQLDAQGLRRELRQVCAGPGAHVEVDGRAAVSFASCDYLDLARHPRLVDAAVQAVREQGTSRGSARLLAGHDAATEALELRLAEVFGAPSALVFASGSMANLGIVSALAGEHDLIVSDVLSHASSIDACRLSRAVTRVVDPSDDAALDAALADADGFRRVLLLLPGVPSMQGCPRPLDRSVARAEQAGALVIVDDAHGLGSVGPGGRGSAAAFGVAGRCAAQVGNLGKALGSYGAFVLVEPSVRELLLQTSRPFVFTCALPPAVHAAALAALELLSDEPERVARLQHNAQALRAELARAGVPVLDADPAVPAERASPIVPVPVGSARRAVDLSARMLERGWFVPAVRPPTVPAGGSRLRLTANVAHEPEQLAGVAAALGELLD